MCFSALPTHFDVGIFSVTQCVGVTQFFSRFLSREMDPCEIVYSVNLWEEGESGAPYLATLVSLKHCLSNNGQYEHLAVEAGLTKVTGLARIL